MLKSMISKIEGGGGTLLHKGRQAPELKPPVGFILRFDRVLNWPQIPHQGQATGDEIWSHHLSRL
jgi:hypothetical protein